MDELKRDSITSNLRKYGGTFALSKEAIAQSKVDRIRYEREHLGMELGVKIAQEKVWSFRPEGDLFIGELRIIVFTPEELKEFLDQQKQELLDALTIERDEQVIPYDEYSPRENYFSAGMQIGRNLAYNELEARKAKLREGK